MEKYLKILRVLNLSIKNFNVYLKNEYWVDGLAEDKIEDKNYFFNIVTGIEEWLKQTWPNSNKGGVYFLFGYQKDNIEKVGVYIGKASLGSKIGDRFHSHLKPFSETNNFEKGGFILDYISSIDLERKKMIPFASALEEFIISDVKEKIYLLNSTGNK
ncbi:MAG: hypothetical protein A2Y33_07415 [Spirochaetes bacterium GWF1_51_8]|nr:MAG: hypothetical protein A2Y33_07415 [Spirochaetes bacterium GWF1_51_8]